MAERTVDSYVTAVSSLVKQYHRPLDQLTDEEVQDYLLYLRAEKHLAAGSINLNVSALRRFYNLVLHRPTDQLERLLPHVRGPTRRPQVFSRGELEQLFTVGSPEPKPRAFLRGTYLHVQEERLTQIQGPLQQLNRPPVAPPQALTL
jgi:site-specific recombinase XerD